MPKYRPDEQRQPREIRETIAAKTFNLFKNALRIFAGISLTHHTADQPSRKPANQPLLFKGGHTSSQLVGLTAGKACCHHRDLHHLLLKQGYTLRVFQYATQFFRRILYLFLPVDFAGYTDGPCHRRWNPVAR